MVPAVEIMQAASVYSVLLTAAKLRFDEGVDELSHSLRRWVTIEITGTTIAAVMPIKISKIIKGR